MKSSNISLNAVLAPLRTPVTRFSKIPFKTIRCQGYLPTSTPHSISQLDWIHPYIGGKPTSDREGRSARVKGSAPPGKTGGEAIRLNVWN